MGHSMTWLITAGGLMICQTALGGGRGLGGAAEHLIDGGETAFHYFVG